MAKKNEPQTFEEFQQAYAEAVQQLESEKSAHAQTEKNLTAQIAELTGQVSILDKDLSELKEINGLLQERLETIKQGEVTVISGSNDFESKGETYELVAHSFKVRGVTITAKEALADQYLLDELVSSKSGLIKKK